MSKIIKINENQFKKFFGSINTQKINEWGGRRRYYGGNSGYQGYSKSIRAVNAEANGLRNKTQINPEFASEVIEYIKEKTGQTIKVSSATIKRDLSFIRHDEWHHTSKYGNKTYYYSVETVGDYYIKEHNLEDIDNDEDTYTNEPIIPDKIVPKIETPDNGFKVILDLEVGDKIEHERFGKGVVVDEEDVYHFIQFDNSEYGNKKLLKRFAPLKRLNEMRIYESDFNYIDDGQTFGNYKEYGASEVAAIGKVGDDNLYGKRNADSERISKTRTKQNWWTPGTNGYGKGIRNGSAIAKIKPKFNKI